MAKLITKTTGAAKPARSKTRAAATKPRPVRKTAKKTKPEVAPAIAAAEDVPVELGKKDLVERLVQRTEMKQGDARRALEAVLGVVGEALAEGANISAAPLGKMKITRSKDTDNGKLVVCRIKLKGPQSKPPVSD